MCTASDETPPATLKRSHVLTLAAVAVGRLGVLCFRVAMLMSAEPYLAGVRAPFILSAGQTGQNWRGL